MIFWFHFILFFLLQEAQSSELQTQTLEKAALGVCPTEHGDLRGILQTVLDTDRKTPEPKQKLTVPDFNLDNKLYNSWPSSTQIYTAGVGGLGRLSIDQKRIQFNIPPLQELVKIVKDKIKPYTDVSLHIPSDIQLGSEAANTKVHNIFMKKGLINNHKPMYWTKGTTSLVYKVQPRDKSQPIKEVLKVRISHESLEKILMRDLITRILSAELSKYFLLDKERIIYPPHMPSVKEVQDGYWFEPMENSNLSLNKLRHAIFLKELSRKQPTKEQIKNLTTALYLSSQEKIKKENTGESLDLIYELFDMKGMDEKKIDGILAQTGMEIQQLKDYLVAEELFHMRSHNIVMAIQDGFNLLPAGTKYHYPGKGLGWLDMEEDEILKEIQGVLERLETEYRIFKEKNPEMIVVRPKDNSYVFRQGFDSSHDNNSFLAPAKENQKPSIHQVDN